MSYVIFDRARNKAVRKGFIPQVTADIEPEVSLMCGVKLVKLDKPEYSHTLEECAKIVKRA